MRGREKYGRSIEVLHDVSKHLRSIEELYKAGMTDKAMEYTRQIRGILKPLVPEEYSDNPMLNILLADRKQAAERIGIRFVVRVESTGLGFIEPVDVTTLFGNLLENAMQAVLKCSGERCIKVHINMTDSEGNNLYEKINYGSFNFAMGKHDSIGRVFFFS